MKIKIHSEVEFRAALKEYRDAREAYYSLDIMSTSPELVDDARVRMHFAAIVLADYAVIAEEVE